jgi:phage terminase large subunit GpA-like protein
VQGQAEVAFKRGWNEGIKPLPDLTVSEWADEFRVLSGKQEAEKGPWRTSRTPYLKEVMDCLSPQSPIKKVKVIKGTQLGFTQAGMNWQAYSIHINPGPLAVYMPREKDASKHSKHKLTPMIETCDPLRKRVRPASSRDAGNTIFSKEFPGGLIDILNAGTSASFRHMSYRDLVLDEIDEWPHDVGGQGDPVGLAGNRQDAFSADGKMYILSSPTIDGASSIQREFKDSDQRHYYVACPHCRFMQVLKWENIIYKRDEDYNLVGNAALRCTQCGVLIEEHHKPWMLENAEWRAHNPGHEHAGFHLSSLYSPWLSWDDIVKEHLKAEKEKSMTARKKWVNTRLAEPWQEKGEAPEWKAVAKLRRPYSFKELPSGVRIISCSVDVQKNSLIYAIRGWGARATSWLLEHDELYGETDRNEVWNDLALFWDRQFGDLVINRMLIDSGYNANMVYAFCRKFPGRALATKGHDTQDKPVKTSKIDITLSGRTLKKGMNLWHINTDYFKSWVHGRVQWDPDQPGAWLISEDTTDDYCKQIVSESLLILESGKRIWKKHGPNHYLDCEVLNAAGAHILKAHALEDTGDSAPLQPRRKGRRMISQGVKP